MRASIGRWLGIGVLGSLLASCGSGDDCPGIATCALGMAVTLAVSALPDGGPVNDATVQVSGPSSSPTECSVQASTTVCTIHGSPGTYTLEVSAPGFQRAHLSVRVGGSVGECDCPIVETERLGISLERSPTASPAG